MNIKKRISMLEVILKPEEVKTKPFTLSDWTIEELTAALLTPTAELKQKADLTDWPQRTLDLTDKGKAELLNDVRKMAKFKGWHHEEILFPYSYYYDMAAAWLISNMAPAGSPYKLLSSGSQGKC